MKFIDTIAKELMIEPKYLKLYLSTAPHRYKVYWIKKKNGRGKRQIAHPAKALKQLQRIILRKYYEPGLPVHDSAMAYRSGKSIRDNAFQHCNSCFLLKMDFENFFPSIIGPDFVRHVNRHMNDLGEEHAVVTERLFFREEFANRPLLLSIGAPSSPFISNTLMYDFDLKLSNFCQENDIQYTRYADDLTFSALVGDKLESLPEYVESTLNALRYPRLRINDAKTISLSKKHSRRVTGLILTNDNTVSIGRERKREIRAMVHRHTCGKLPKDQIRKLKGLLAFAYNVEPDYYARLKDKYHSQDNTGLFFDIS